MKKYFQILIVITSINFLSVASIDASTQFPDYLIYEKDTFQTYNLVLETYLQAIGEKEEGKLFGLSFREGAQFNCWRGYQALYEIKNDSLFLSAIMSCGEFYSSGKYNQSESQSRMKEVFPDEIKNNRVFLYWFDGRLSQPHGDQIRHDGVFYRIFEQENVFKIKRGLIKSIQAVTNYVAKKGRQDRRIKSTINSIFYQYLQRVNWDDDKCDCQESYHITINNSGKIGEINMPEYSSKSMIEKYWEPEEYKCCIDTLKHALKGIRFNILKDKGKSISETINIEIWLDANGNLENWIE